MNRTTLKKLLIGFFLAAFILFLGLFNLTKPRILVLHSFSSDDPWSLEVNKGIQKVLKSNRNPVTVKYHYLNVTANKQDSRLQIAIGEAHQAIARQKPDILIAVDDEANELVAKDYAGKGAPRVVFVSTLQPLEKYGYAGAANVSGIVEQLPLDAVRDTLLTARNGKAARIAVLGMDDVTCRAELAQVQSYNWAPHRLVVTRAVNSFPDWQQFTRQVADKADVLLVLSYGGLERGNGDRRELPGNELAVWLEKNAESLPISICPTYVQDGGGLAVTPAPVDFGQKAMQMALAWVAAGKGAAAPPVISSPHFRVGMRQSLLDARGITMPTIYIEAARIGDAYLP